MTKKLTIKVSKNYPPSGVLNQPVKPIFSYAVLGLGLLYGLFLAYEAWRSPLVFFEGDKALFDTPFLPLNRQEYKDYLLNNRSEFFENLILGEIKGQPNFKDNVKKYDILLKEAAKKYQVDCTLIKATMMAESHGKPHVKSSVGATGLMQLMPSTARAMGYPSNLKDPRISILAGTKYMAHLKNTACHEKPKNEVCDAKSDVKFRLAAYNGGSKCNKAGGGSCSVITMWECLYYDGYSQTRHYVNKVKANYKYLKDKGWGC